VVLGGGAFSYERGTPVGVDLSDFTQPPPSPEAGRSHSILFLCAAFDWLNSTCARSRPFQPCHFDHHFDHGGQITPELETCSQETPGFIPGLPECHIIHVHYRVTFLIRNRHPP